MMLKLYCPWLDSCVGSVRSGLFRRYIGNDGYLNVNNDIEGIIKAFDGICIRSEYNFVLDGVTFRLKYKNILIDDILYSSHIRDNMATEKIKSVLKDVDYYLNKLWC